MDFFRVHRLNHHEDNYCIQRQHLMRNNTIDEHLYRTAAEIADDPPACKCNIEKPQYNKGDRPNHK